MCLPPSFPARPVTTEMFSDREQVRFLARETMEVYMTTRAEMFVAACGSSASPREVAEQVTQTYAPDERGGFSVHLRSADAQLYALSCGVPRTQLA